MKTYKQKFRAKISSLLHSYFDDRPIQWAVVKYSVLGITKLFGFLFFILVNVLLGVLYLLGEGLSNAGSSTTANSGSIDDYAAEDHRQRYCD